MSLYDMKMAEESPEVASNLTSTDIKIKALDNQLTALKNRVDVLDNKLGYEKGENKAFRELNLHLVDRIKKLEEQNKLLIDALNILYSNYYYDYEKDFYRLYETDNSALRALNEFEEKE